ncbi:MAG TPA: hypothetical protein VLY04_23920 [Bryobacteraceae bacterium]|nr:hypothetical protein [Bryobacteraceae bacterium]
MPDPKEALDDVSEMISSLQKDPYAKLNDTKVVWLLKMWTKAALAIKGSSVFGGMKLIFTRRGNPGKPSDKNPSITWRDELYADLVAYKKAISFNSDNPDPTAFQAAQDAMVGLVEEYRNNYRRDSKQDKAFDHQVRLIFIQEEKAMAAGQ